VLSGLIRKAADPQRLYNFSRSAFAQRVAHDAQGPVDRAGGSRSRTFNEWDTRQLGNIRDAALQSLRRGQTVSPRRSVSTPRTFRPASPRTCSSPSTTSKPLSGMYNASLGEKSNEKSGKAIMARQREGDTATFHYQDNLNRAIALPRDPGGPHPEGTTTPSACEDPGRGRHLDAWREIDPIRTRR
jgi:hypothetical protein